MECEFITLIRGEIARLEAEIRADPRLLKITRLRDLLDIYAITDQAPLISIPAAPHAAPKRPRPEPLSDKVCARDGCDQRLSERRAGHHKAKYCSHECMTLVGQARAEALAVTKAVVITPPPEPVIETQPDPPKAEVEMEIDVPVTRKRCAWCDEPIPLLIAHKENVRFCSPRCGIADQNDKHKKRNAIAAPAPIFPETITVVDACEYLRRETNALVNARGQAGIFVNGIKHDERQLIVSVNRVRESRNEQPFAIALGMLPM